MSIPVVDRRGIPLLGKEERAEQLVAWSERNAPGKRWTQDFAFGLRLSFVSEGSTPSMYMHWSPQKFRAWLDGLGSAPERLCLVEYGISVEHYKGRTLVRLLGAGQTGQILWDTNKSFCYQQSRPEEKSQVNWLLGLVVFSESGPQFLGVPEAQSQLQNASALAIIEDKPKTAPVVRPKQAARPGKVLQSPQLTPKARAFLLQDILLNTLAASAG